jgi:hypothetical protein
LGYTHYTTQTKSFTTDEWQETSDSIREILAYTENLLGVPLADGNGTPGTRPVFDADAIMFNGVGDDSHETFIVHSRRQKAYNGGRIGLDFCKTARKPYDVAVTACLCYLSSVTETHAVTSDGKGSNFLDGLNAARQAVPAKANILDIPMDVMHADRWTGPWISGTPDGYEVRFCIDGMGYVGHKGEWHRFETHEALGRFLLAHRIAHFRKGGTLSWGSYGTTEPDIWNASGSFDPARHRRIARAQARALAPLFPPPAGSDIPPPAFVRPGDLPRPEDTGAFHYSLADLMRAADTLKAA